MIKKRLIKVSSVLILILAIMLAQYIAETIDPLLKESGIEIDQAVNLLQLWGRTSQLKRQPGPS